eukprot:13198956-Alexandrium_andersonii.AAC.1
MATLDLTTLKCLSGDLGSGQRLVVRRTPEPPVGEGPVGIVDLPALVADRQGAPRGRGVAVVDAIRVLC